MSDVKVEAVLNAVDNASKVIDQVREKITNLKEELSKAELKLKIKPEGLEELTKRIQEQLNQLKESMPALDLKLNTDGLMEKLNEVVQSIQEKANQEIKLGMEVDTANVDAAMTGLQSKAPSVSVRVTTDTSALDGVLAGLQNRSNTITAQLQVDTSAVEAALTDLEGSLPELYVPITMENTDLEGVLDSLDGLAGQSISITADAGGALGAIAEVQGALDGLADKEVTVTVTTRYVEEHAAGGMVGGFSSGGKIPGYGGGDIISTMLEPGEFVINKRQTRKFGDLLHAINAGAVDNLTDMFSSPPIQIGALVNQIMPQIPWPSIPPTQARSGSKTYRFDIRLNGEPVSASRHPVRQMSSFMDAFSSATGAQVTKAGRGLYPGSK